MKTPSDENFEPIEAQLAQAQFGFAPVELRAMVLGKVHRELRSSRWDRRLGRATVVLLVVGLLMNVAILEKQTRPSAEQFASRPTPQTIAELAVSVAEATDAKTARSFALHMATLSGLPLSSQQTTAIQYEIDRRLPPTKTNGKAG